MNSVPERRKALLLRRFALAALLVQIILVVLWPLAVSATAYQLVSPLIDREIVGIVAVPYRRTALVALPVFVLSVVLFTRQKMLVIIALTVALLAVRMLLFRLAP